MDNVYGTWNELWDTPPSCTRIDKVYVSWTELWDVNRYVEHYLRTRKRAPVKELRARVLQYIERYPGEPPFTKSSLDYFLDKNFARGQ